MNALIEALVLQLTLLSRKNWWKRNASLDTLLNFVKVRSTNRTEFTVVRTCSLRIIISHVTVNSSIYFTKINMQTYFLTGYLMKSLYYYQEKASAVKRRNVRQISAVKQLVRVALREVVLTNITR